MKIPLNDLHAQHKEIRKEIKEKINYVIKNSQFINGDLLTTFENNFASYCGKKYCVGTSSGTASLSVTLACLGIKPGDEVILPVNTFIATAFAITLLGAKPIFVDVKEEDSLINPEEVEKKITKKTRAIIAVHLYGNICDIKKLKSIAKKRNLHLIEDCAQAHGSTLNGKKAPIADIGCFSFFPSKSLGAMGDAGAIVTNNQKLAKKMKQYVNQGRAKKYLHEIQGFNFRLDVLQAAILDLKLKKLDSWINRKKRIAQAYDKHLTFPTFKNKTKNAYYVYTLLLKNEEQREKIKKHLEEEGISTAVYYPLLLHRQPAFKKLKYKKGDFPVAEKHRKKVLSIPIYPHLTKKEVGHIIKQIKKAVAQP